MKKERTYTDLVSNEHVKSFSQYFTISIIADFMAAWVCKKAKKILDPAVGNSVFFKSIRKTNKTCKMKGYEIDAKILHFFGNPTNSEIVQDDYLFANWDEKYDGIICNPPYNKFQAIKNRHNLLNQLHCHTGIKYSGYTNQYILFLAKSIHQLSDRGRLAYIIPTEFFNSSYGSAIKQQFIQQKLVRAVINFQNNNELFFNAVTTCCMIFIDKEPKKHVDFYNIKDLTELNSIDIETSSEKARHVDYSFLQVEEKWRTFLNNEKERNYKNLTDFSNFCKVSRGIATGDNDFFCFSHSKAIKKSIPSDCFSKCICHSADIKTNFFSETDFKKLANSDKTVYLLDIDEKKGKKIENYIAEGLLRGVDQKYLPKTRKIWYSMEKKDVAPIWITTANRSGLKVVRNLSSANNLTTFHSIFVKKAFSNLTDVIFCYLLTPIGQDILRKNRKELGNGLEKFQPGDLNSAKVVNFQLLSKEDINTINSIAKKMSESIDPLNINILDKIFRAYVMN